MGGTAPQILFIIHSQPYAAGSSITLFIAGLALSMTVNTLVTGLIVFRILKVFQEVRTSTADDQILGVTGGNTLQRVIFIIIESGIALFSIQLIRLVVTIGATDAQATDANIVITGIHEMLDVIMTINYCYVILLRT